MRNSLVMQFCCSECGGALNLDYDDPRSTENRNFNYDNKITGSLKVHNYITVHPCKYCFDKAKEPALMIKKAISLIGEFNNNDK
mgnify:CR=1 FL=1